MNRLKFAGKFDCKLSENAEHAFAERHALNVYKSNSIYSFIPKNACSTLRLSLAVANGVVTDGDCLELDTPTSRLRKKMRTC